MAVVAVEMRLPPREVWEMSPIDMATVVDVLEERARKRR